MTIDTIHINGIPTDRTLRARVTKQMTEALALLKVKPGAVQVTFFDDNGPKGGRAIRCALTVRLPLRTEIRVEHTAETARLAFAGSFEKLERQLARRRERELDLRRRPKKYYVAKRFLGG